MTLRLGSLCSGYSGLEMGVQAVLGGTVAWHSEIDPGPCKVLAHRYPGVPNLGDMTAVDWLTVEPVDVLTGGTPCQDLSHAGKRRGMTEGTRSNLWVSMREAIAVLRPGLVVWENVRGAYSACADSEMGRCPRCVDPDSTAGHAPYLRALGRVVGDLSELGYVGRWTGLRAADVGAPHGRFRVFVVAWPAGHAAHRHGWGEVARGLREGRGEGSARRADRHIAPHPDGLGHERGRRARHGRPGPADGAVAAADADNGRELERARAARWEVGQREAVGCESGRATPGTGFEWGAYGPAVARWERTLGRVAPPPTERGRNGPRLSPAFVEWMMGLPAGWVTDVPGVTRNEALKMLGNGVVPQQAAEALRRMLNAATPPVEMTEGAA